MLTAPNPHPNRLIARMLIAATAATMILASYSTSAVVAAPAKNPAANSYTAKARIAYKANVSPASVQPYATSNLVYHTVGSTQTGPTQIYTIFWAPGGYADASYQTLLNRFETDMGANSDYGVATQYFQVIGSKTFVSNGSTLAGSFNDTAAYPAKPVLDSQVQAEITRVQSLNGWTPGINKQFVVFLQSGEDTCFDGTTQCFSTVFCAYHGTFGSAGSPTIYSNMPYDGTGNFCDIPGQTTPDGSAHADADHEMNVASHESIESVSDPLLNAWFDSTGNEIGDKCNFSFGATTTGGGDIVMNGHGYEIQREWSNAFKGCTLDAPLKVTAKKFAATHAVSFHGTVATFTDGDKKALARDFTATVAWGDGSTTSATLGGAGPFTVTGTHTYATAGTYVTTITAADHGGADSVSGAKGTAKGSATVS